MECYGWRVILDADLADLYGVPTKRLNEQVKRNRNRFPEDFMFQLTSQEKEEVVAICDHLHNLKYSKTLPYAFTEHGTIMAASILNTRRAIDVSVFVVRAFIRMRELLEAHKELTRKLMRLEQKVDDHDDAIQAIVEMIHELMRPPEEPEGERIGIRPPSKDSVKAPVEKG